MIYSNYILLLLILVSFVKHDNQVESCQTNAAELFDTDPYQLSSHILDIGRGIGAKNVISNNIFLLKVQKYKI